MDPILIPQTVCSPVYHCFPPRLTTCMICKHTDASECPYKKADK